MYINEEAPSQENFLPCSVKRFGKHACAGIIKDYEIYVFNKYSKQGAYFVVTVLQNSGLMASSRPIDLMKLVIN